MTKPVGNIRGCALPTWREAWALALYGGDGFSVRGDRGPRHDFSTSVTRGPALGVALAELLARLNPPAEYDVVDVGAGDGRLLADLRAALPPDVAARGRFVAVELAPRPDGLPVEIEWRSEPPEAVQGLLIAHELLDTVPCEIVEVDAAGTVRIVGLDAAGGEFLGDPVEHPDAAWLERWWPISRPGQRAEVGRSRDERWHDLTARVTWGLAVAVDYGHTLAGRPGGHTLAGRPGGHTLAGWARGRAVPARPDGSCDLTAHVAFDSCRQPGDLLLTQRAVLTALAADPTPRLVEATPREQLLALAQAGQRRALLDPEGLGGYLWLVHGTPGLQRRDIFRTRETDA